MHELFSGERLTVDRDEIKAKEDLLIGELPKYVNRVEPEAFGFEFSESLFPLVADLGRALVKRVPQEMASTVPVGNLSFADLRRFWGALLAISRAYQWAAVIAGQHDYRKFPIRSAVLRFPKARASEVVAGVSGIPSREAEKLVDCYTYDPRVAADVPILQPLLPISNEELCIPSSLIHGNNFERNFFKLLQRHPALLPFRSGIEQGKEPIAIDHLKSLFPAPEYGTKENIVISGLTDADLVVYEVQTRFALVIQHKWLVEPDTVDESQSNDERLREGAKQSVNARDYFREHHAFLCSKLGLLGSEAIDQIQAVVVCRGAEPTSFLLDQPVPIITEVAFAGLWKKAATLNDLWEVVNSRPDKKDAAAKVTEGHVRVQLSGYEFVMPGLAI